MEKLYLSSLRGLIGDWVFYPCLMKLRDIAERVDLANEIYESASLSDLVQRELKKERGKEIKEYLLNQDQRFFNSLIVGVHEGEPNWYGVTNIEGKDKLNVDEVSKEIIENIGILCFSGEEKLFTLDGQHRLVGIKLAIKDNPSLGGDDLAVIFIGHKTDKEGKERSRRLFTTLNKNAKPVSTMGIIALDEDDTMAITVRRLVKEYSLFQDKRISLNATRNLPINDFTSLTTITNLYDLLNTLFIKVIGKNKKGEKKRLTKIRLNDQKLEMYYNKACEYFDLLVNTFYPLKEFLEANDYSAIVKKYRNPGGGNILFRPIGLSIVTELVAKLSNKYSLNKSIKHISNIPLDLSKEPYNKVIWRPAKQNIINKGKTLTINLLLYMLNEEEKNDSGKLIKEYAKVLDVSEDEVTLPAKL